jgi:hypothetical protein
MYAGKDSQNGILFSISSPGMEEKFINNPRAERRKLRA